MAGNRESLEHLPSKEEEVGGLTIRGFGSDKGFSGYFFT